MSERTREGLVEEGLLQRVEGGELLLETGFKRVPRFQQRIDLLDDTLLDH
jgi:hypothetical protein